MKRINLFLITLILFLYSSLSFAQQSNIKTYGFYDLEVEVNDKDDAGKYWTFDLHHFNVITIYQLDENFRIFGEIEWEHGPAVKGTSGEGLVALERGWLEYKYSDAFKVKTGKYLPPFGLYNLKHDAGPTFLSVFLPNSVYGKHKMPGRSSSDRLYAKFGMGIQVLGSLSANEWESDYYLYLSNGRGPKLGEKDNNPNKGVGGRFVVRPPLKGLGIGVSYYTDKNGNASDAKQSILGLDVAFHYSSLQLEAELILPSLEEVDTTGTPNDEFQKGSGYYIQGAYTFGEQLTPFARYEIFDSDRDTNDDGDNAFVLGVNFSVTPRVYLKSEIQFIGFEDTAKDSYKKFASGLSVAF